MNELSVKEKRVYEYICRELESRGYSPSVRDIQKALDIKSTSSVHLYLKRLEELGYITKEQGKSRTLRADDVEYRPNRVPILGSISAGAPISAEQNFDGYVDFVVPKKYANDELFALKVRGYSMKDAGILHGDTVIVLRTDYAENGDIVVALVNEAATVKTFYRERGHFRLQPESSDFEPIILKEVTLLGRVIACQREY